MYCFNRTFKNCALKPVQLWQFFVKYQPKPTEDFESDNDHV